APMLWARCHSWAGDRPPEPLDPSSPKALSVRIGLRDMASSRTRFGGRRGTDPLRSKVAVATGRFGAGHDRGPFGDPRGCVMTMFEVPESVRPVRDRVEAFMRERVEPAEADLHRLADAAHHEPSARGE